MCSSHTTAINFRGQKVTYQEQHLSAEKRSYCLEDSSISSRLSEPHILSLKWYGNSKIVLYVQYAVRLCAVFGSGSCLATWIRYMSLVATHLVLLVLLLLAGATSSKKSLKLSRFKSDGDEIWHDCSSSEYASIDEVEFRFDLIILRWQP